MSISYTAAYLELTDPSITHTVASLFDLVGRTSGAVAGASLGDTYLLYSGKMPDGVSAASVIASEIVNQAPGNVHDIGASGVGRLMDAPVFDAKLRAAIAQELGISIAGATPQQLEQIESKLAFYREGKDLAGNRISSSSLWDFASHQYVSEAKGEFRIIAPSKIDDMSVFAKSELPALLENPNITTVDGVAKADLVRLRDLSGNLDAVKSAISAHSLEQVHFSGLSATNTTAYLAFKPDDLEAAFKDPVKLSAFHALIADLQPDQRANLVAGVKSMEEGSKAAGLSGIPKALNKLGVLGGLLGFVMAAKASSDAEAQGNTAQATEIMKEWAVDAAGSGIGSIVGAAVGGIAVAALAAVGAALTAPVSGALILGATLLGGLFGGTGTTELYHLMGDRDKNGRRDIVDRLANLFFGANSTITTPLPADLNGGQFTIDANLSRDEMVSKAKTDIAWRYALRELNAFVVTDVDYARHNADGSLDLLDPQTGVGAMTDRYLADRAAMLAWKIRYETNGARDDDDGPRIGAKPYNEDWDTNSLQGNWDFVDLTTRIPGGQPLTLAIDGSGISLSDHQVVFGNKQANEIDGGGQADSLYGMDGNDKLFGGGGDDYLEGGAGSDVLDGGDGNDTLVGGRDFDIYKFSGNWGHDVIDDSDGQGAVVVDSNRLEGGLKLYDNVWRSAGKDVIYSLVSGEGGRTDLSITFSNRSGSMLIRNWTPEKNLGIVLSASSEPNPNPGTPSVPGTTWDLLDRKGNDEIVLNAALGNAALLNYTGGRDHISYTGSDNIIIYPRYVTGASDQDVEPGGDALIGGSGNDLLATQLEVQTGSGSPFFTGQDKGEDRIEGNGGVDILAGGNKSDQLYGGTQSDFLFGGRGADYLDGGDGDDVLFASHSLSWRWMFRVDMPELESGYSELAAGGLDELAPWRVSVKQIDGRPSDYLFDGFAPVDTSNALPQDAQGLTAWSDYVNASDPLDGTSGDVLKGGAGNDQLYGSQVTDYLFGEAGRDLLIGRGGVDYLYGGSGDDWLDGDSTDDAFSWYDTGTPAAQQAGDFLYGEGGDDQLEGRRGNDYLDGGVGNDTIWGDQGSDTLIGGAGDDFLSGDSEVASDEPDGAEGGDDTIFAGEGSDVLLGGAGDDSLNGEEGDDRLYGGGGADVLVGGDGNDQLNGGAGDDHLEGGEGSDQLIGGAGNDILDGGAGDDILRGGEGSNIFRFSRGWGRDTIDGGSVEPGASSGNVVSFADGIFAREMLVSRDGENLILRLRSSTDILIVNGYFTPTQAGGYASERIQFADGTLWGMDEIKAYVQESTDGNDSLLGLMTADTLSGGEGRDTLLGFAGDDALDGGAGNDELGGGTGNDFLTGGRGNDVISGDEGNDVLLGGAGQDNLSGGDGNDILEGGEGNDYLKGGQGVNIYRFARGWGEDIIGREPGANGSAGSAIEFLPGISDSDISVEISFRSLILRVKGGGDTVTVEGFFAEDGLSSYTASTINFSNGVIWDFNKIKAAALQGTSGNDDLGGFLTDDVIAGGDGRDQLRGSDGSDFLDGGAGNDELSGGEGDDTLVGGSDVDSLYGGAGADNLFGGAGNDSLNAGSGDDTLDGGAGNDVLDGGEGNDVYRFNRGWGEDFVNASGDFNDIIEFGVDVQDADLFVRRSGDDLILGLVTSADSIRLFNYFAGATVSAIKFANGVIWNQSEIGMRVVPAPVGLSLSGTMSDDVLSGGAGNDHLNGGEGVDTLDGGAGNDDLEGGNGRDAYLFGIGSGRDTVFDWDENLIRVGTGITAEDLSVSGGGSNGNSVYLTINGTGGRDRLEILKYFDWDGTATGVFEIRFADGSVVDLATMIGQPVASDGDDNIFGSLGDDTISGAGGNDNLRGAAGDDILFGDGGDDWLRGDDGNDRLWGGANDDSLNGGNGNDELEGGNGADQLYGEDGADTLNGGSGNDTLNGGHGEDIYLFGRGSGSDEINEEGDANEVEVDIVKLGAGLSTSDIEVHREVGGNGLILSIRDTDGGDQLRIQNYFDQEYGFSRAAIERIQFADGTIWDYETIKQKVLMASENDDILRGYLSNDVIQGLGGDDQLDGREGDDILDGGNGDDTISGGEGNDHLIGGGQNDSLVGGGGDDVLDGGSGNDSVGGGSGNDLLRAGAGNDTLQGDTGNDELIGEAGNDLYFFGDSFGRDVARDFDETFNNNDVAVFDHTASQLWFRQVGNDLEISVIGTNDALTVEGWYMGSAYRIEQIKTGDGKTLLDGQVQNLVQAMAGFAPPAAGQTTLPPSYQAGLSSVIAANWH